MRILVSEFITGGGMAGTMLPKSLAEEGQMMLKSIVDDLCQLPTDDQILITLDQQCLFDLNSDKLQIYKIEGDYYSHFRDLCSQVDAVLPIAPESDHQLEKLCSIVLEKGKLLLASDPETVKLCASKIATMRSLAEHNIATIETQQLNKPANVSAILPSSKNGWIVKPNQGIGCESVIHCSTKQQVVMAADQCTDPIVQAKILGIPASISMLCNQGESRVIGYNQQMIEQQGNSLQYTGTKVNALVEYRAQFDQLAADVSTIMPGLRGYIGMDVIIQGSTSIVVEINPRLTTSYVGLHRSIGLNPARLILDIFNKNNLSEVNPNCFKDISVTL